MYIIRYIIRFYYKYVKITLFSQLVIFFIYVTCIDVKIGKYNIIVNIVSPQDLRPFKISASPRDLRSRFLY